MTNAEVIERPAARASLLSRVADKYGVEPGKLLDTLKATAFKPPKEGPPVSNEQMMALLIVAEQYGLNPFTRELFAFPDKLGGIVPFVSVDGWVRIVNQNFEFNGVEFQMPDDGLSCECVIHRKDREHPTRVTEYLTECKRDTAPWRSHPRRMLRHKAFIQCARMAFGFALLDEEDAQRVVHGGDVERLDDDVGRLVGPTPSAAGVVTAAARKARASAPPPAAPSLPDKLRAAGFDVVEVPPGQPLVPPVPKLAEFADALDKAPDAEEAGLIMDRGRTALSPEDYEALQEQFRGLKWGE